MREGFSPIVTVSSSPTIPAWDTYVDANPAASTYHRSEWPIVLAAIFGLEAYYLSAEAADGRLIGVLPMLRQRSLLFGDRLVSLPFVNYGGALADDQPTRDALHGRAIELARSLRVDSVELRDARLPPAGWACRADKATLRLDLPSSPEQLFKGFGSKLRSQVRRAERDAYEVRVGGGELVTDFYSVFAEVMRDLGTPVYPRRFFVQLAARLPQHCTILTVHRHGSAVAAAFLVGHRGTLEIPWAATIAAEKSRATNMLLYAEVLQLAVTRGYQTFDFGRSTIDSGPYRFKLQWGAQPVPLHWAVWPAHQTATTGQDGGSLRSAATRIWARLPLPVANQLGPLISPSLPW